VNRAAAIRLAVLAGIGILLISSARATATYLESEDMGEQDAANLRAFLALIRQVESNNNYNALVMGGEFSDFSDHPALLGWDGVRLDDGRLTTAAGAYQITRTTWRDLGGADKYGSFDPAAQDAAAADLIKRRGALNLILAGQFDAALSRLVNEWEAFARILAGTYPVTKQGARTIYADAGGTITG